MTKVAVTETYLTDIADAIRQQTGSVDTYKPSEMASAILDIPSGGGGGNFFTAYSKHNGPTLYADSEYTQSLIDAYNGDRAALWEDLKSADSVRIIEDDPSFHSSRLVFVASCIYYDEVEPEIIIYYIRRSQGVQHYNI